MSLRWASAKHCEKALGMLSKGLMNRTGGTSNKHLNSWLGAEQAGNVAMPDLVDFSRAGARAERLGSKRQRLEEDGLVSDLSGQQNTQRAFFTEPSLQQPNSWQPVLEYTGPDFGFDTTAFGGGGSLDPNFLQSTGPEFGGLFDHDMWEAYIQGAGDFHNF